MDKEAKTQFINKYKSKIIELNELYDKYYILLSDIKRARPGPDTINHTVKKLKLENKIRTKKEILDNIKGYLMDQLNDNIADMTVYEVIFMYYIEGCPKEEITEILNVTEAQTEKYIEKGIELILNT